MNARERTFRFPPDPAHVRMLRTSARSAAEGMGVGPGLVDRLVLVLDEIVNNAIEHGSGYRTGDRDLSVRVAAVGRVVEVDFEDPEMPREMVLELASALEAARAGSPPATSERGRGLFLIAAHCDELEVGPAHRGGLHLHGRISDGSR